MSLTFMHPPRYVMFYYFAQSVCVFFFGVSLLLFLWFIDVFLTFFFDCKLLFISLVVFFSLFSTILIYSFVCYHFASANLESNSDGTTAKCTFPSSSSQLWAESCVTHILNTTMLFNYRLVNKDNEENSRRCLFASSSSKSRCRTTQ